MELKYIHNTHNLPVGYGYRLLDLDETIRLEDEVWCDKDSKWIRVGLLFTGLVRYFITYGILKGFRRQIDVGEGYELISENESCFDTEYIVFHFCNSIPFWHSTHTRYELSDRNVKDAWGAGDGIKFHGVAYRRKKEPLFKPGDYVVNTEFISDTFRHSKSAIEYIGSQFTKGKIYIVREYPTTWGNVGIEMDDNGCATNGMSAEYFRKATRQEIENHLLGEALARGFITGAKINVSDIGTSTIQSLNVIFPGDNLDNLDTMWASSFNRQTQKLGKPFVAVLYRWQMFLSLTQPLANVTLHQEELFKFNDGNDVYTIQFYSGHIEYIKNGKVIEISNQQIRDALRLLNTTYSNSNTGSEVGFGGLRFSHELLSKIINKLIG